MAPVDLALPAGGGFKADERALLGGGQALTQHDGGHLGGALQQVGERVFEGIALTGSGPPRPGWSGIVELFAGRLSAQAPGRGDLPYREALMC